MRKFVVSYRGFDLTPPLSRMEASKRLIRYSAWFSNIDVRPVGQ